MSTPSPVPLDNFDLVSPYAPKRAQQQSIEAETTGEPPADLRHPPDIETDHDARILDEIEGFRPNEPERSLYLRVRTDVTLQSGEVRPAWAYFYNAPLGRAERIPSGDYLEHLHRHARN